MNAGTSYDSLRGSRFADQISLGATTQVVDTAGGNDLVFIRATDLQRGVLIAGGTGLDELSLSGGGALVFFGANVTGFERLTLNQAASVVGSDEITTIFGSSGNDTIDGLFGNVTISGGLGADTIQLHSGGQASGGEDDDRFILGTGDVSAFLAAPTILSGGSGVDTLQLGDSLSGTRVVTLDFGTLPISGIDRIQIEGMVSARLTLTEALLATADADGNGTTGDMEIVATPGSLLAQGIDGSGLSAASRLTYSGLAGGNDTVSGGAGADSISGGDGNDQIDGGNGADSLRGGTGNDTITGGGGADTIRGDQGGDLIQLADDGKADKVIYSLLSEGTTDLETAGVTEAQADRITGYDLASDQFVFNRTILGLNAGGVTRVSANGVWTVAGSAVFVFESDTGGADTILNDNFALASNLYALNTDNGDATGSAVNSTALLFVSNVESSAVRRTGIYHWIDLDGDALIEATDTVRLLGVIDGVTANQIQLANILLV